MVKFSESVSKKNLTALDGEPLAPPIYANLNDRFG
jgi:hypothetical protein